MGTTSHRGSGTTAELARPARGDSVLRPGRRPPPGIAGGVLPAVGARVVLGERLTTLCARAPAGEGLLDALGRASLRPGALHRTSLGRHLTPFLLPSTGRSNPTIRGCGVSLTLAPMGRQSRIETNAQLRDYGKASNQSRTDHSSVERALRRRSEAYDTMHTRMTEAKVTESRRGAVVEFDRVTKRYGGKGDAAAVQELSMRAPGGEVCGLVGPSGCGKTTTLKMVNRLVEPSSGHVLLDGDDIGRRNPVELRRRIGSVIQQTGLFPHLTVGANVATVPRLLGWDSPRAHARVDELIDLVGLDPDKYRDRYPAQLSGGERQRIGVARAIATDPPVLLMDEPFGAVDPITRERLQNEFLRLQQQLDTTILFVTHDIDEAIKMGDRIAVFKPGGRLAQFDTPMTVLEQPAGTPEPLLDRESTLRDALSAMLGSAVQEGLVVDERGRLLGSLSIEAVSSVLRQEEPVGS